MCQRNDAPQHWLHAFQRRDARMQLLEPGAVSSLHAVAGRDGGGHDSKQHGETSMTTKAGKLTTLALAAALGTALAVPAMAQDVSANVGVNANVGATATVGVNAGAGAATGGVTGLLGGLLNNVTGLLGGLGLGGIL
jgi:hypothetical protein